jgi:hypothetical protein
MYEDIVKFIKSCEVCQRRKRGQVQESLHLTFSAYVWQKVGVDVVFMPDSPLGFKYIVFARDDLSGWIEGRALKVANSKNVSEFLFEEVICRHGCPERIVMDGGSENMDLTRDLIQHYGLKGVTVSPYHPEANGLVQRRHELMVNSLAKYSQEPGDWPEHLPLALWADRISIRRSTGYTAFELVYGRDCVLPVEFSVASWSMVDWESVRTREDLIVGRMTQLDARNLELTQAAENLRNSRKANKAYFDDTQRLRSEKDRLQVGDLVLLYRSNILKRSRVHKLDDRWSGPYRIKEVAPNSTFYRIEELDGTPRASTTAGNQLKRFFSRDYLREDWQLVEEYRQQRNTGVAQRRARSQNPARHQELMEMVDAAQRSAPVRDGNTWPAEDDFCRNGRYFLNLLVCFGISLFPFWLSMF